MLARSAAWTRSIIAYVVVGLYILVAGLSAVVIALITRRPSVLYWVGYAGVRLALGIPGVRVRAAGVEHVRADRPTVYCANHTSNVEPPILFNLFRPLFPRLHILYKAGLRQIPVLGSAFEMAGFVGVHRGDREKAAEAISGAARTLRGGGSFVIFPEGTRSRTDELLPFKKGGFVMALEAQAVIVPVAILGGRDAMERGSALVRPATVSVRFGEPIATTGQGYAQRDELIADVRRAMERLIALGPVTAG